LLVLKFYILASQALLDFWRHYACVWNAIASKCSWIYL